MWRASRRSFLGGVGTLAAAGCVHTVMPESVVGVPEPRTLSAAFRGLRGVPVSAARVGLLSKGADAWAMRWHLLSSARRTIDTSYFIVEDDAFGLAFLGRLYERARAGVLVRLLIDARGSQTLAIAGRDHLQELVQTGGVDVRVYNPILPQIVTALVEARSVPLMSSTHNKVLLVDNKIGITGGRNVSRLYYSTFDEDADATGDCDVVVEGDGVIDALAMTMLREFNSRKKSAVGEDLVNVVSRADELLLMATAMDVWMQGVVVKDTWADAVAALEDESLRRMGRPVEARAVGACRPLFEQLVRVTSVRGMLPLREIRRYDVAARVVANAARVEARDEKKDGDDEVNDALVRAIGGAQKSIWLESPYFIPTPRVLQALERAGNDGVKITLLTNSPLSSDNALSQAMFVDTWPEVVARVPGMRVFAQQGHHMVHGKRAVFDDTLTYVGTYNIDPFSSVVNSELFLASWSREFADRNLRELLRRTEDGSMIEYLVARDRDGNVLRYGAESDRVGEVKVAVGPDSHTPAEKMESLRRLKAAALKVRPLWGFALMVW